jgi:hypothetical protein
MCKRESKKANEKHKDQNLTRQKVAHKSCAEGYEAQAQDDRRARFKGNLGCLHLRVDDIVPREKIILDPEKLYF